ncbi:helix-turn-helix domain-containing protein [Tsuneonella amylolytica]|uniref:helix-turn-helix domain-containing protein n=1 Tax=Tsuneonella amylolytica TaxID=2338327 RepID=UPI000EA9111B|nr:helix-turn-helix domain-containing protein [Tsuneonella amylolytica]
MGAVTRKLIESGSHVPGVDPATFQLPFDTALRYERAGEELQPYVADYHVLDSIRPPGWVSSEIMLPGGPAIRFILEDHDFDLAIGSGPHGPLPKASLYGSLSRSAKMRVGPGGVTIGVSLTPLGLARIAGTDADRLRDTVVPLESVIDPALVGSIQNDLKASDRGPGVKAVLDAHLRVIFVRSHPHDDAIQRISAVIAKPGVSSVAEARELSGMSKRQFERLTKRYFGFPPKLLLRRARLLRSIIALKMAGEPYDMRVLEDEYFDHSHFTRDSHRFLGMSPLRFLRTPSPYRDAALRARSIVLGSAVAALDATVESKTAA